MVGAKEFTISPANGAAPAVHVVLSTGALGSQDINSAASARPTFYLVPETILASGNGTQESPFKIN